MKIKKIHLKKITIPFKVQPLLILSTALLAVNLQADQERNPEQERTQTKDQETLGLPTSNNDGTIVGILPAPSGTVEAGAEEGYVAEELKDGQVDRGVENISQADRDTVRARTEREQRASGFDSSASGAPQTGEKGGAAQDQLNSQGRGTTGQADVSQVTFTELPQKVQNTMRTQVEGVNMENVHKIKRGGDTWYQATYDKGNLKGAVTVAEDGSLIQLMQVADFAVLQAAPAADGGNLTLKDVPEPVQKTIQQEAGTENVGKISKASESGKTLYHVEFNQGGVQTDLMVGEDGKMLARADQTALLIAPLQSPQKTSLQSAPEAVQKTIREQAGQGKSITDLDKGTWQGQTAYKVMIEKNGKPRPLIVSESGEILGGKQRRGIGAPASSETSQESNSGQGQPTDRK